MSLYYIGLFITYPELCKLRLATQTSAPQILILIKIEPLFWLQTNPNIEALITLALNQMKLNLIGFYFKDIEIQ